MIKRLLKKLPNALITFCLEPSTLRRDHSLTIVKRRTHKPNIRQQVVSKEINFRLLITVYQRSFKKCKIFLQIIKRMSRTCGMTIISVSLAISPAFGATHNRPNNIKFWNNHELIIFYKYSCGNCKQFGSVLHSVIQTMQIPTVNFTLDAGRDPNYQNTARMLPLLKEAISRVAEQSNQTPVSYGLLPLFLKNSHAKNLPLVFLMSSNGNIALVSSGVVRSDRWLQQLLRVMQAMAQEERSNA